MSQQRPNHLVSIPLSLFSPKLYVDVHDQPFTRTLLFLLIIALALTLVGLGIDAVGHWRQARSDAAELAEQMGEVTFQDGKASAGGEQPRLLWVRRAGEDGPRILVVVLDTTGKLTTLDEADDFAGCPQANQVLFFGREKVEVFRRQASGEKGEKGEKGGKPTTVSYEDAGKIAELRQLIESNGGRLPAYKLVDGVAQFELPAGQVHVLCHTREVMALADATGRAGTMGEVLRAALAEDAALRDRLVPPQFLALVTGTGVLLRCLESAQVAELEFAAEAEPSGASVARWVASAVRQVRTSAALRAFLPYAVMNGLQLFILALLCSLAGLGINATCRGRLQYTELLTMAVYATVPAAVVSMAAAQVVPALLVAGWGVAVPVGVGMVYTALGALRVVRGEGEAGRPTI